MNASLFLAKLLGPYCVIMATGVLLNQKRMQKLLEEYTKSAMMLYFGGILALFFGLLVVSFHNIWAADWRIIITVFGWAGIIKGCLLVIFPDLMLKLVKQYQKNSSLYIFQLSLVLILGIYLTFKGFTF